jgi:zinc/manganese transport system substrate-binding protein
MIRRRTNTGAASMRVLRTLAIAVALALPGAGARAELRIVTSTPTFADIARQVGGEHVDVESIMNGPENVHTVNARPSYMMLVKRADLFCHAGLDAEPWVPQLLKGARNPRMLPGGEGNVDLSVGVPLREIPSQGQMSRAFGDIHVYGNTHYFHDPMNAIIIARTMAGAFAREDPANADAYAANADAFAGRMEDLVARLREAAAPFEGAPVVVYHRTWPYLLSRFGFVECAEIEPKPGIQPGPQHIREVLDHMEADDCTVILAEAYANPRTVRGVAERSGATVVEMAHEVNAIEGVDTYDAMVEHNVNAILDALRAGDSMN